MNDNYFEDIVKDIIELGYERRQIIHYRILNIPQIDFDEYITLKESNISIISNNCWGGIIYHTLALECLSPFKNLSVGCKEYIEILKNFHRYMSFELKFKKFLLEPHSHIMYPVMDLGGIEIHCNHDTDPDIAKEKWKRRVKKINCENLFYEMYTESHEDADKFCSITGCNRKVCFVPFKGNSDEQVQLFKWHGQKEFYETVNVNVGIATGSYKYNPIKLLIGENATRCKN